MNSGCSLASVSDGGPDYVGKYLVLNPGESYKDKRTFKLDNEIFNSPGEFTMNVAYGQFLEEPFDGIAVWKGVVASAELNFRINACKSKHHQR